MQVNTAIVSTMSLKTLILRRHFTRSHMELVRMPIFPLAFSTVPSGILTQARVPKSSLPLQLIVKSMIVLIGFFTGISPAYSA